MPPTSPPPVQLPEFEGPLDLLLDEVRRQNVAIEAIAMAPVVARFLEYVGSAAGRNLNLDIEWLHMAATLIHWKSRSLLPGDATEDPRKDPIRDELVQRLLAYRQQAAGELARRRASEETRFTRSAAPDAIRSPDPPAEAAGEAEFLSVWDLIQQARELAHWTEQYREDRDHWRDPFGVEPDGTTVCDMMDYLRYRLAESDGPLDALALMESQATVSRRSCLFLGMLEMALDRGVELAQYEPFGPIWIAPSSAV
jgi:segregation and condensation protein A